MARQRRMRDGFVALQVGSRVIDANWTQVWHQRARFGRLLLGCLADLHLALVPQGCHWRIGVQPSWGYGEVSHKLTSPSSRIC